MGLSGAEGPEITELLLHALADPDVKAQDAHEFYELDKVWVNVLYRYTALQILNISNQET